jgi:spore coat polysaccharide biosynthesis protein SpsF
MTIVAIVQARMGSTRLPGKVLADISGKPMLDRVLDRAASILNVDEVVVATSCLASDDPISNHCATRGTRVIRGSETDVLERFVDAARATNADVIVRITADCPLLDPVVGAIVVNDMTAEIDYASNTLVRTFPRGLDIEATTRTALERAHREATDPPSREHVTYYIYNHPEVFRLARVIDAEDHSDLRWTVDTEEDLALVRTIYGELGDAATYRDVLALCKARPELTTMNAHIQQKRI